MLTENLSGSLNISKLNKRFKRLNVIVNTWFPLKPSHFNDTAHYKLFLKSNSTKLSRHHPFWFAEKVYFMLLFVDFML